MELAYTYGYNGVPAHLVGSIDVMTGAGDFTFTHEGGWVTVPVPKTKRGSSIVEQFSLPQFTGNVSWTSNSHLTIQADFEFPSPLSFLKGMAAGRRRVAGWLNTGATGLGAKVTLVDMIPSSDLKQKSKFRKISSISSAFSQLNSAHSELWNSASINSTARRRRQRLSLLNSSGGEGVGTMDETASFPHTIYAHHLPTVY